MTKSRNPEIPKSPVRPAVGRRQRRFFELATAFQYAQVSDYPETLYTWQATAHPRKWAYGSPGFFRWQTVVGEALEVHQVAGLDGSADPSSYAVGRARGTFPSPNDRGSYGIAERADEVNLWEVVWLEPVAQMISGHQVSATEQPDGTVLVKLQYNNLTIWFPLGGLIIDQDPAQPIEIHDRRPSSSWPGGLNYTYPVIAVWNGVDWDLIAP